MKRTHLIAAAFVFSAILLFHASEAHASAIKAVQSGTTVIPDGTSTVIVPITAVDTSKAFLVFGTSLSITSNDDAQLSGQISSATTLTFQRIKSIGQITVEWYVAEFQSDVTVQRGQQLLNGTQKLVTLPQPVDPAKSFPVISARNLGPEFNNKAWVRAKIVNNGQQLEITVNSSDGNHYVEWQVIEYSDALVQTGDVSFGTSTGNVSSAVTAVDLTKSWLVYSYKSDSGTAANIGQKLVRGLVCDATTVCFDRDSTGQVIDLE